MVAHLTEDNFVLVDATKHRRTTYLEVHYVPTVDMMDIFGRLYSELVHAQFF